MNSGHATGIAGADVWRRQGGSARKEEEGTTAAAPREALQITIIMLATVRSCNGFCLQVAGEGNGTKERRLEIIEVILQG